KYLGPYTLIDARIETGRTHQIRVHLQSIGFPIVGDPVYGNKRVNSEFFKRYGIKRQFLHSHKIGFKLLNGRRKVVESKLPEDLANVLHGLGG
ncbi:RNA pseudouridine synthase, partial [Candidatus Peregrinibacteria bacterium]|nr:RNA pseudouridine synthase [Candidatus Peregrinibacteria bacterium]